MTRLYEEITHLIPCAICPTKYSPIQLGPVRFIHASTFNKGAYSVPAYAEEQAFQDLDAILENGSADWIAEVRLSSPIVDPNTKFDSLKKDRQGGETKANLCVDIAIGCIQAAIELGQLDNSHRLTARASPTFYSNLQIQKNGIPLISVRNNQPGLAVASFGNRLNENVKSLNQMGNRLSEFSNPDSVFPKINEAWCSAVYWYHQALAEPINTIRVIKLVTAIEILLHAEKSSGLTAKITETLKRLTGLCPDEKIKTYRDIKNNSEPKTVTQLANNISKARSTVLHGTQPTFPVSEDTLFGEAEWMARTLITGLSQTIEVYQNAPNAKDAVKNMLATP